MSDDTKALVERARELAGYKYQHHTIHVPAALNLLADTIESLERDRDALAERCEKLREALQQLVARYTELVNSGDCGDWNPEKELEVIDARAALAAPKNAP